MAVPRLVFELVRRRAARLVHALAQQRDLLLVRRPLLHALARHRLDALHELDVVLRHERDRLARAARARGASHAVDVVLRVCRDVVVDDGVDVWDIEATGKQTLEAVNTEAEGSTDRLATSVATRTLRPPLLNLASAPNRALWLSWPCNGTAGNPNVRMMIASLQAHYISLVVYQFSNSRHTFDSRERSS